MPCKDEVNDDEKTKEEAMAIEDEAVVEIEQVQVVQVNVDKVLVTNSYVGVDRSTYQTVIVQDLNLTFLDVEGNWAVKIEGSVEVELHEILDLETNVLTVAVP